MRNLRRSVLGAGSLALLLLLGACGSGGDGDGAAGGDGGGDGGDKGSITVGSDAFAEAQIVGEMYAQVLENAGYDVERQLDVRSREVRLPAMESGEIDVAPEYLASLLSVLDPNAEASSDPEDVAQELEPLLDEMNLAVLQHSDAVDTNAFVVTPETAEEHGLEAVSDLQPVAGDMTLGGPPECPKRPFCIPGLKEVYDIEFGDFTPLELGPATVAALQGGEVDVALLFSTSSVISANDLVLLEDDKDLQAADNITPLVHQDALDSELEELLNGVSAALTTENITELNARVEIDQEPVEDVAAEFLEENGLLD
ncbi:MAG TPA: ABC transporter substrate-binding protein [Actinomycetota bacterium]|nr:ABC transporter substrate-binding protein [Actinomycetota bacterium]